MKKQTNKLFFYSFIFLSFMLLSCSNDDDNVGDNVNQSDPNSEINQGASVNRGFMGRVLDENSNAISGASVNIGSISVVTNADGRFIIDDATVTERQALISIEKSGYLKSIKTIVPTNGMNAVTVMMVTENLAATINSGSSSTVSLINGAQVTFDGNFKTDTGTAYSGTVDVLMYHLNPSNSNIEEIMPGNLQAINNSNEERVLETYGMLNVELRGSSGEHLNIADNSFAQLEMPIDPAQTNAPATIPLWSFNENTGLWEEDGFATKQGSKYVGEVSHFSWWNCDAQFPTVTLCLNVVDTAGNTLSNVRVELWRTNATYPRTGHSNGDGEICGLIPKDETLQLKAFDQCGAEIHSQNIGPFSVDTNFGNVILPSITTSQITGNLADCNGDNVTNGYVTLEYGNQTSDINVSNGEFTFNIIECPSEDIFTLEGVDYSSFQSTGALNYNISNTSVGNIITCNSISEFISVQLDNDPVVYYLSGISSGQTSTTNLSVNANTGTNDYFFLGGQNTTVGTYDSSTYTIESSIMNIDYNQPINISYNLNAHGAVGEYIDMNFSGTYTDTSATLRSVTGTVHIIRD